MRSTIYLLLFLITFLTGSCITEFIPETGENQELMIVEGLLTDQKEINTIKLSRSQSLLSKTKGIPYQGCTVIITDDLGNVTRLAEQSDGIYVTDSSSFKGEVGRTYKLTVITNNSGSANFTYESVPVTMLPVPPVDTIYYEKKTYSDGANGLREGAMIWFDSHDPSDQCKFYRWDYIETWRFQLPYTVVNSQCWISTHSTDINISNASILAENRITKFPLVYVTPESDRLSSRYSLLLNQYSVSEDEFNYWERLKKVTEEVGSLYDITPSFIPGNLRCLEDPSQDVLGYFSVSAKSSKRVYVSGYYSGLVYLYKTCPTDTVSDLTSVVDLNKKLWVIESNTFVVPPIYILTSQKSCADCTVRGSKTPPSWWNDSK
jgi:hypothetical protein